MKTKPMGQAVSLTVPKHTWGDLTPWERRTASRHAAFVLQMDRWRRQRAGKEVAEVDERLAGLGVVAGRWGWSCGDFPLPWDMGTPEGVSAFEASLEDTRQVRDGWAAAFRELAAFDGAGSPW